MLKSIAGLATLLIFLAPTPAQQTKKRVAVMNFDYATVYSSVASIFGSNADVGKGVADLVVERLVSSGTYSVVERKSIDRVLAEQNFSNSDRADPGTAAKLGRLLGVDAIIIGSITQFGRDDKTTSLGGFGSRAARYGLGGMGKRESSAVVALSARLVSADTGEILAVAGGKGQSSRSGTSLTGSGSGPVTAAGGVLDMSSKNFGATILGEAVNQAVADLARQVDQNSARVPVRTIAVDGLVADVSGDTIVLNVGSRVGVKIGDRLEVKKKVREITDPETGKVIRRVEEQLGFVVITEVDEASSVGKYSGSGSIKVGDTVRKAR